MKVLLTGADGFLGSHILRCLLNQNFTVKAFLQKNRSHFTIQRLDFEPFFGDILNITDIETAIKDCDIVIHTVAITDVWPNRNNACWEVNYKAVKILSEAVRKYKIKKFIHIGTANSFGYGSKELPGTESSAYNFEKYGLDYMDSKKAAQDYLLKEHRDSGLPVVIINPTFMIGEYDSKPGSGEMVLAIMNQRVPGYANGGRCVVYVGDVAVAAVNAISKGESGECYIAGGENLCYKEFFNMIAEYSEVKAPKIKLPFPLMIMMGYVFQIVGRIINKDPLLSVNLIRISQDGHYYSSLKAIEQLDMPQTDIKTAIKLMVDWFYENNYCNR